MNYPIDKIIVMTLERTPERQWMWMGASSILDIDPEIVYFAIGKDNKDFGDDMRRVADAAADDGFPFVAEYAQGVNDDENSGLRQTAGSVCQCWNYARILRELADSDETALIIFDDKMLSVKFSDFCEIVHELQNVEDEEFYALQLRIRGHYSEISLPELDQEQRMHTSRALFQGSIGFGNKSVSDVFFQKGIAGFDESFVFSPVGAKWMLKCLDIAPDYYRYLDHFICQGLPDFAESMIKRNKGIYCPAELGYAFVDDLLPMGTTTDFAVEGSPHYDRSRKQTTLQYLFKESSEDTIDRRTTGEKQLKMQLAKILEGDG